MFYAEFTEADDQWMIMSDGRSEREGDFCGI